MTPTATVIRSFLPKIKDASVAKWMQLSDNAVFCTSDRRGIVVTGGQGAR